MAPERLASLGNDRQLSRKPGPKASHPDRFFGPQRGIWFRFREKNLPIGNPVALE